MERRLAGPFVLISATLCKTSSSDKNLAAALCATASSYAAFFTALSASFCAATRAAS